MFPGGAGTQRVLGEGMPKIRPDRDNLLRRLAAYNGLPLKMGIHRWHEITGIVVYGRGRRVGDTVCNIHVCPGTETLGVKSLPLRSGKTKNKLLGNISEI